MMSILHTIKQNLRAWKIARIEQDIDWARASSDAHIRGLEVQLATLRLTQYQEMRAQDIARRMDAGKLA